jgi:hypothetical protein
MRNATFSIWQRGTSITVAPGAPVYVADGWMVGCTGASVVVSQVPSIGRGPFGLKITGQAGVTDCYLLQVIESVTASPLASQADIVQAKLLNNTGGTITPTLTLKHPGAADTWASSSIDVSLQPLQPVANAATVQLSYFGTLPAGWVNGGSVRLSFGNSLNGALKSVTVGDYDVRVGAPPTVPLPELRNIAVEFLESQRYLPGLMPRAAANAGPGGVVVDNTDAGLSIPYFTPARAGITGLSISDVSHWGLNIQGTPTGVVTFVWNGSSATGALLIMTGVGGAVGAGGFGAAGDATNLVARDVAAWLVLTGAEINGAGI